MKLDSLPYIISHSEWFYAVSFTAAVLLLALAIIEYPAVPIPGFTPSLLVVPSVFKYIIIIIVVIIIIIIIYSLKIIIRQTQLYRLLTSRRFYVILS